MQDWSSGYVTDIVYTHGFYRELTPALMEFQAAALGQRRPGARTFCELGCGQGFSTNLLASANPQIDFYANDFNPSHIAAARELADEAGTPNVCFFQDSFADFLERQDLPAFDIIALHGVYSWVSSENRARLVEFVRRRLAPGGLVYVSYNALPGLSQTMPLRQLMVEHGSHSAEPTSTRIDAALAFADRIKAAGALYFSQAPLASARLDEIGPMAREYLAHEYFNRDWTSFYHSQVAADFEAADVAFIGSAQVLDHFEALSLPPVQQAILDDIGDPAFRETVRDFLVFQHFRRDLYARAPAQIPAPAWQAFWLNQRFALSVPGQAMSNRISTVTGDASLPEAIYAPIMAALKSGPKTGREILAEPAIWGMGLLSPEESERVLIAANAPRLGGGRPFHRAMAALAALVGANQVQPALPADGEADRRRCAGAFNRAVLRRARNSSDLGFLASPVTGGGLPASRMNQLFLLAHAEGAVDPAAFAARILGGVSTESPIQRQYEVFVSDWLPMATALGVL